MKKFRVIEFCNLIGKCNDSPFKLSIQDGYVIGVNLVIQLILEEVTEWCERMLLF